MVILKICEPEVSYILGELFNMCLKESCFLNCGQVSWVVPVFKNVGKGLLLKTTTLLVFFLWLVFENLIALRNVAFFLISSMALGLLDQLQIF